MRQRGCTAGDTDQEAFGFGEFLSRFKGLFVADREDFIIDLRIEGFRNEVGTDAWILCGPAWLRRGAANPSVRWR